MLRLQIRAFQKILQPVVSYSTSTSSIVEKPLVLKLMEEFESISYITGALQNKKLSSVNFEEWKSRIYTLKNYQFEDADCFKMISKYPDLLKIPLENFQNTVKNWYHADFGINNFHFLLLNQPNLLEIDMTVIRKRVPQLRVYFRSAKRLCDLLVYSPNVMFDEWEAVKEKLNYILKERNLKMEDVVESKVLLKPLLFIKFRFELLEKCGVYKQDNVPVHKINKYDKTKYKNPSLKEILNPNVHQFAKLAQISREEYAMCKALFFESDNYSNDDDDDDTDYSSSYVTK